MKTQTMSSDAKVEIIAIGSEMTKAGLPPFFVAGAVETAFLFEGVYDLFKLWKDEEDQQERDEIVADIQDLIEDCSQKEKVDGVLIRFDDLEGIAKDIRKFKDTLRAEVDNQGGLNYLSGLTGIPQPSLSRFFNTESMPRRTTLHKIARALKLNQIQIATEWSR